jgi:uncharacterized membrane protein YfcA
MTTIATIATMVAVVTVVTTMGRALIGADIGSERMQSFLKQCFRVCDFFLALYLVLDRELALRSLEELIAHLS